ncbi:MAG: hypothetical protein JW843_11445 [Candidatus Aminicenantes bacterium]|nr:hypothetical protein [Candidatus Aminicenantes bacterium]
MARKWDERYNEAKIKESYGKVLELDPNGTAGTFTHEYYKTTAPYRDYAELALASQSINSAKPDLAPLKAFIAKHPGSPLLKRAWQTMSQYYSYQAPKEEAAAFFPEYAAKFPDDPTVLSSWLTRIVRDKEPADKGLEIAERIKRIPALSPYTSIEQQEAALHLIRGDRGKAEEVYGKDVMADRVDTFAYTLINYANFWLDKDANKDSAVAMAEKALMLMPDDAYYVQQVAGVYVKAGMEPKALALYGPDFLQKNFGDAAKLYSYASFWNRQGKNLESAAVAAEKACAAKPGTYYYWNTLASISSKMKKWPEAIKAGEKAVETAKGPTKEAMQKALDKIKQDAAKK